MPPLVSREATVLLDMAGCPNRCRHCWLGAAPNRRLPPDELVRVAEAFRSWHRPGDDGPFLERIDLSSWYREPDYSPDYRRLHELELELSAGNASRFELLSIWRLARDPEYAAWAREVGTEACQITFFGLEEATDWFTRRRRSFRDALAATERLLEAGIRPRRQVILTRRFLPEADAFVRLVDGLRLDERVAAVGGEFDVFLNLPSPNGEAFHIEHPRPAAADMAALPSSLVDRTLKHFGADDLEGALGRPEGELLAEFLERDEPAATFAGALPERIAFVVDSRFDVCTNLDETAPWCRLGNLWDDGLDEIMLRFEADATPGLQALFHTPVVELARRYGRPDGDSVFAPSDLLARWVRLWAQERWEAPAARARTRARRPGTDRGRAGRRRCRCPGK